jgi:hypothetical protein
MSLLPRQQFSQNEVYGNFSLVGSSGLTTLKQEGLNRTCFFSATGKHGELWVSAGVGVVSSSTEPK